MDSDEQFEAGAALMDWFKSQNITAVDASSIMLKLVYAIMLELEEECKARSS
jgi:hypothetical protein